MNNDNIDSVKAKWDLAVRNKVFTSGAYEIRLPNGTMLQNGYMTLMGKAYLGGDDDLDVKRVVQRRVRNGQYLSVGLRWTVPGLIFNLPQLAEVFEMLPTLTRSLLYHADGRIMFFLERIYPGMFTPEDNSEADSEDESEYVIVRAGVALKARAATDERRLFDPAVDLVHGLCLVFSSDRPTTEEDFLLRH